MLRISKLVIPVVLDSIWGIFGAVAIITVLGLIAKVASIFVAWLCIVAVLAWCFYATRRELQLMAEINDGFLQTSIDKLD